MKRNKKIFILLLLASLIATGCSGGGTSSSTSSSSSDTSTQSSSTSISSESSIEPSSSAEPISSSEEPSSSAEPISSSEEPVSSSAEPISSSEEPISSSAEPISSSAKPISSSSEPISSSSESSSSSSSIVYKDPQIIFDGETSVVGGRNDHAVTLPRYTLLDGAEEELSDENLEIIHYLDGEIDDSKVYKPGETAGYYSGGDHIFKFTLTDPKTGKSCEEKVTLSLYQKILYDTGGDMMSETVEGFGLQNEENDPYYRTTNEGWGIRNFYMDRGYQYYAECYFPGFDGGYRSVGMLHCDKTDLNASNFYKEEMWGNPQNNSFGYHAGYSWNNDVGNDSTWFTQGQDPMFASSPDFKTGAIKCACARNGDDFYFFVNDILVTKHTIDIFKNRGTLPGFLLGSYHQGDNKNRTNAHDIDRFSFCSGTRAVNKIESLISNVRTFDYLRYDAEPLVEWAKFNKDSSNKGMGFKYTDEALNNIERFWDNSVFPRIRFWGDFKVEFDYELSGVGNDWGNLRIAFADSRNDSNSFKTAVETVHSGLYLFYNTSLAVQESSYLTKGGWEQNVDEGFKVGELRNALGLADNKRDKFHIAISKKENFLNNTEEFTYVFSKADASYSVKSVVENVKINDLYLLDQIRPLYIYFTVDRMYYSVSNFTYEALPVF